MLKKLIEIFKSDKVYRAEKLLTLFVVFVILFCSGVSIWMFINSHMIHGFINLGLSLINLITLNNLVKQVDI